MANERTKRRQYGSGALFQRKDGLWVGRIEAGWTSTGARRRVQVTAATKAQCRDRLNAKAKDIALNGGQPPPAPTTTVKAWADQWLKEHERDVRPRTYATDSSSVRVWIIPTIGRRRLADLNAGDVRKVRDAILEAGRSTTTAHRAHRVLVKMLKDAVTEGHLVPRSALGVKAPAVAVSDRDAMSADDMIKVLGQAAKIPGGCRWLLAALYGPRSGEALGLTWDHIDFERGIIDVSWQLQPLPYLDVNDKAKGFRVPDGYEHEHLHRAFHLVRPKTSSGVRVWPLVPEMASALKAWLDVAPENPWGLLWTGTDSRYGKSTPIPIRAEDDRAQWHALQALAGVAHPSGRPYHLHETRHATVTMLLDLGVDPDVVKAIVGHSTIVATLIYRHVQTAAMSEAVGKIVTRLQIGS